MNEYLCIKSFRSYNQKYWDKRMLPRYTSFRDFDFANIEELRNQPQELHFQARATDAGKIVLDPTEHSEPEQHDQILEFLKIKPVQRNFEISFEASFMDEHQNSFKKQTENFIELSLKKNVIEAKQVYINQLYQLNDFGGSQFPPKQLEMNFQEKDEFLKQIKNQQKLSEFISLVNKTVDRTFACQLNYVCYLGWQRYKQIRSPILKQSRIMDQSKILAKENLQKIFNDQRIKFLNLKIFSNYQNEPVEVVKSQLLNYLQFIFTTVMLVAEQYFENPYYENDCGKRNRAYNLQAQFDSPSLVGTSSLGAPTKKSH